MDGSIFAITRRPDGGGRSWFGAPIALRTNPLSFEEQRGHGQHESIQNGVRKRLPALHRQSGEEGSYEGGGACIIQWLTGYDEQTLQQQIDKKVDFETFFTRAPRINPNVSKITGVICGYRVEEIEDKLMQKIRYLDKLVDELAKGKAMDKILRK
jgi:hypothetical protein